MKHSVGEIVNERYEVQALLGVGGMGEVYLVTDRRDQKPYALKRHTTSTQKGAPTTALFEREYKILASLDHPNVIKVYEAFTVKENHYYTMEYLPGQTLKDWLAESNESKKDGAREVIALQLLLQLAKALHHVHERGIIHHDVHPHNVQLIKNESYPSQIQVKLLDFGTSLLKEAQQQEEIVRGARDYKSPEHSRGEILNYTADVYCFGAIAYEVLTGKQPFSVAARGLDESVAGNFAALAMHALRDVPMIQKLDKKIAYEINRMVQICMEKEPEHRYQSMQEVIGRIEATLARV